jgi:phosphoglucosamine mutase
LFGTDGVRGRAGVDLTVDLALRLAQAAADVLTAESAPTGQRPFAVVGRDTRPSGEGLEAAVVAGLTARGVDVHVAGVLPTPATAFLTASTEAQLGVMLSASHNPMPDNGIKFFGPGGRKLSDATEDAITAQYESGPQRPVVGGDVGRVRVLADGRDRYIEHVLSTLRHRLDGLKVVVDCANGAGATVAPEALRRAGAEVIVLFDERDGVRINDACGSTHPRALQDAVVEHRADAGIALDGDADRCLAVDASGSVVDGDQIMGVLATAMNRREELVASTLVATVMSNVGLQLAMRQVGVEVLTTAVGDRYVLEEMERGGYTLGGEQSGHVVMAAHATTGDGLLTGLHLLAEVAAQGRPLAEVASVVQPLPQILVNVPDVDRSRLVASVEVADAVAAAEAELAGTGRVLLRPSGTEPLVRVMVEAQTHEQAERTAHQLADVVRRSLG